ncbi:unnamed protein product [Mytilus coruscus]|uniref:PARP catalytic domain-containing protein n=1 Tax=Mytilus coruscus TaxID=42192 RepID=A0A6J8DN41_MYTCO|nr:unnamed protein product [Mytilus coruscus]
MKVKPVRDLNFNVWQEQLKNDFDKDFLLHGIKNGFDIVQNDLALINISAKNHPSALPSSPLFEKTHQQILTEIENGNYEFTESTPKIISPLDVIPKPDGDVRIIHDCSRPLGSAVNEYAGDMEKQKFQSVDDAAKLVTKKNCFMAKVDLKSAYRSVGISHCSQQVTGVEIDSTTLELRLPLTKLEQLRAELADFKQRKHVSKKQLQSLAGKLNWASSVVHGRRVFLLRIIDGIMKLKHDWHKMCLCSDILHDIHWWYNFMFTFNGKSLLLNTNPVTSVYTDACKTGAGGMFGTDWLYVNWKEDFPFAQSLHINEQEAFAVALAAKRWAKCWKNRCVHIFCDNSNCTALHVKMIPAVSCPSPAFLHISKGTTVPLTYSTFLHILKHSLSQLKLDTSGYSGHSFCRGGATFALECGVSSDLIQAQGDWKSEAYKGTAYGAGVYFAVNSSYSIGYCTSDTHGMKHMFSTQVLTGDACPGSGGMTVLPQKPGKSLLTYDSASDNPSNPVMFIIFHDSQAYPTYHVFFK